MLGTAILYLASAIAASPGHSGAASIVGDWLEDETYGGGRTIAVGHFRADGSFSVDFRECKKPTPRDHTETGTWTYVDGKLEMKTVLGGPLSEVDIEDYRTISNDGRLWIYKSIAGPRFDYYGPVTFHDERIEPGDKPPACDLTS